MTNKEPHFWVDEPNDFNEEKFMLWFTLFLIISAAFLFAVFIVMFVI